MKKIGIITLWMFDNYGNRLQNFAVQEVLKDIGCEGVSIPNTYDSARFRYKKNPIKLFAYQINKIVEKFKVCMNVGNAQLIDKKRANFKLFNEKYIDVYNTVITPSNIPKNLNDVFSYFIVGSDQVWNYNFAVVTDIHFLKFTEKQKRIAYAASFGISEIDTEYRDKYIQHLSEFKKISVRETSGKRIIQNLLGNRCEVDVLIDPTMMLDCGQWLSIAKKHSKKPKNSYIFTYFLGDITKEIKEFMELLCKKYNYEMVSLGSKIDNADKDYFDAGPSEFIDFIASSSLILTDSFHGAVFSIMFEKPFIVFERKDNTVSMNSRLESLLDKFSLINRVWDRLDMNKLFDIDFSNKNKILEVERDKAKKFLVKGIE